MNIFLAFWGFWFVLCKISFALEFNDVTSDVFLNHGHFGLIAAFGDFNSDKLTDLFIINQNGKSIEILLSNDSLPFFGEKILHCNISHERTVAALTPGDFNGDTVMDVLVSFDGENSYISGASILWGGLNSIDCNDYVILNMSVQPLVLDYNDDMIPDILSEDEEGNRCIWLSNTNKTSTKIILNSTKRDKLRVPHSSTVVDLNNDLVSDLMVTIETRIEIWIKQKGILNFTRFLGYPNNTKIRGQSTFVDFNTNAKLDHIMPVCYDELCKQSSIMIWNNDSSSWIKLINIDEKNTWGFLLNNKPSTILDKASLPITLRSGDFNMDGYPDFIVVLENKTQLGQTKAVILENVPCSNCQFGRTLEVRWNVLGLDSIDNIKVATFYDLYNDGTMDILAVTQTKNDKWQIHALKNMDTYDAYFIKVLVLNGLCYTDCTSGSIPYGTNHPGPMIRYNTIKPNGDPLVSCAVQMPQTAYFPLNLPYSVFGLGQTPNFVDLLTVAIPEMLDGKIHKRDWTQIIPNSQMVIIPFPPDKEHRWVNKLFLTPSRLVLLTFLALLGTCGFISMIIMILHWKEKLEDKKEKMQEAYRFPFDAM